MSIKTTPNGYMVDIRPRGRDGKRYRKSFTTKAEAQQFERWIVATQNSKEWVNTARDTRHLSVLIDGWFKYHGQHLKGASDDFRKLKGINELLGNPKAYQVDVSMLMDYRAERSKKGTTLGTINRDHMLLSSVFTVLIKAGQFHGEHPLKGIAKLKIRAKEMSFLSSCEITLLLNTLTGDALKIAKVCLATGARWSEAATLKGSQVVNCKVTFVDTKNGKNRTIPISNNLFAEIYQGKSGQLFTTSYTCFRKVIQSLNFGLPKGQATHVLRHTYASHFMMNGGNILTLQQILGHATIMQTMAYAHLAPDHLQDAITFSPLSTICLKQFTNNT
ncbi:tyrosine-type recombinase/integrase [Shewanella sp. D64]|uniref:phage integrase n=1 Tax=unclassified Shewanella TaxID=196818 RepID=UPI0022BA6BFC|nr:MULTISPECIES: tyrosine-type recombinase/integrase [unclassified Shewanella]MEC4728147.1 tyrosine-type recombinase/integrase [Shewanella sp. D64]MEC4740267.1 tyrosine-type recombinase/integrase [Shewanella sp. E94]WBJ94416.1 tyrosine-type recombinase/integrase [Shewanella sp. MTB7]